MGLHIPLPHHLVGVWLPVPGQWPTWCAWGADPPTTLPSAFSQQQSTVPKVPATFLSRMAQMSRGLAPGSSPPQVVLHTVGTQLGTLRVPKAEQLSPTSACGESGAPRRAPRGTGVPAESVDQTLWEFSFWLQSQLFPFIQLSLEGSFCAPSPASFFSSKSRNRERQKWSKMSDCGFETPELGFGARSIRFHPQKPVRLLETRLSCCSQLSLVLQLCCPCNSFQAISTPRNVGNLKCKIPDVPISEQL